MQYLVAKTPDGVEQRLSAQVTKVYPDGRFDVHSIDGTIEIIGASPDGVRLENENEVAVTPAVEMSDNDKIKFRLQAAEQVLLQIMLEKMGGGLPPL